MNKEQFIQQLQDECLDTDNISFSITTAKGLITLFWSLTFLTQTNEEAFEEFEDEIDWANLKMEYLAKKYAVIYIHKKKLSMSDALHFDHLARTTKKIPVKRAYETDTQSMGGFVQFKNIKEF